MPRLASLTSQQLAGVGITHVSFFELLYTLTNPNTGGGTSTNDSFGSTVHISNNYIAVSAPAESSNSGYVYVYDASNGSLLYSLSNPNSETTTTNDFYGTNKIAINGNNLIVSAHYEYNASSAPQSGVAYVYNLTNGSLTYTLQNPNYYNTANFDSFSWSVAIDGTYALVGAPFEDDGGGNTSGYAYVFNLSNGSIYRSLINPNTTFTRAFDNFGTSVTTNGTLWAIAAWGEDDPVSNAGVVHVYNTSGIKQRTIPNPRTDSIALGQDNKMDLDGNNLLVASQNYAHVIDITNGTTSATLGSFNYTSSVSISGDYALIGWVDSNANYFVDLYDWTTNTSLIDTISLGNISYPNDQCFVHIKGTKLVIGDSVNNQAYVYQLNIPN